MLHFENDYNQGAHPRIIEALLATNQVPQAGYGSDDYSRSAIDRLKKLCACPEAQITFLSGGTQTNQVVIASLLAPYEGVIAADTGHISQHEAGAIEYTGHKVLSLAHQEGKLSAGQVRTYLEAFYADENHEHMVFPGMVYISHPTEYGTLYSHQELADLAQVCQDYRIPLFMDGARLAYALAVPGAIDLPTIAKLTDVFYFGGTKAGTLIGEALVFTKKNQPKHFLTRVKQQGALVAKSRLLGVQFDTLFDDKFYLSLAQHALAMADQLKTLLASKGYRFYLDSPTNQQFIIVPNAQLTPLSKEVAYSYWEKYDDDHTVIRLATSCSTTQDDLDQLSQVLEKLSKN